MFLGDTYNDEYLSLERMTPEEAILHTLSLMQNQPINCDILGKQLMKAIKPIYESSDIGEFSTRMYKL